MQLPPNQHDQPGIPGYTSGFDDIYAQLVQPLKDFNESLNTISGMLDFLSLLKTTIKNLDHAFATAMESAIQKWPEQKTEIGFYVDALKDKFMHEYGGRK